MKDGAGSNEPDNGGSESGFGMVEVPSRLHTAGAGRTSAESDQCGSAELMEAAVAQQGVGEPPEACCSCGGEWVFKGYKERQVMTKQGSIRIRMAYYVCDRCGAGIFPPGRAIGEPGGVELGGSGVGAVDGAGDAFRDLSRKSCLYRGQISVTFERTFAAGYRG